MPYELREIAAISGLPGLYRLLKAARHGVLVESLDARAARSMAPARNTFNKFRTVAKPGAVMISSITSTIRISSIG